MAYHLKMSWISEEIVSIRERERERAQREEKRE